MKLKLVVLAGAKEGLEIPLKKEKFLIGRAKDAHCAPVAKRSAVTTVPSLGTKTGYTVKDLGSRNGTYVNDNESPQKCRWQPGNELRVGPLKFRVDAVVEKPAKGTHRLLPPRFDTHRAPTSTTETRKQPPVKDVADVVQRTISKSDSTTEDDVSRWLLGVDRCRRPRSTQGNPLAAGRRHRTTMSRVTTTTGTRDRRRRVQRSHEASADPQTRRIGSGSR